MVECFDGFSTNSFRFLRDLRANNKREWFELHKADYQNYILQPLQALVSELGPCMQRIDPYFEVTPALNRTISRIYRDIRFSKDKSLYKISHWLTFKRPRQEWQDFPAYFFEISPDSYRYGMGFYSASRKTMDNFRKSIDSDPQTFLTAISFYARQSVFTIEGEEYKRPLKADTPVEFQEWYNRKSFYLVGNKQIEGNRISKNLATELVDGFESMAPLYHYLCKIAGPSRQPTAYLGK